MSSRLVADAWTSVKMLLLFLRCNSHRLIAGTRRFVLFIIVIGVVGSLVLRLVQDFRLESFILIIVASGLALWIHYPWAARRRRTIRALSKRIDVDLRLEYSIIVQRSGMSESDIIRLWYALAEFYRVQPHKLASLDRLRHELLGVVGHPDYNICLCPLVLLHRGPSRESLKLAVDWADLIIALHQCEIEQGRLGTRAIQDNANSHKWIG